MPELPPEIARHYEGARPERTRITEGFGQLELVRTREIIRRHLPRPPASVLDVGGGEGVHATWLADDGYDVHLVDPVEAHVDAATAAAARLARPFTAGVGDARALDIPDASHDAVLALGPCYHLVDEAERVQALREARRVLRPGGVVFVAAISRYASLFDGLARGFLLDPSGAFRAIVDQDLATGQHRNPTEEPGWFTTAYFHRPDELVAEATAAGLDVRELVGVEGLAGWLPGLDERWADPEAREIILFSARATETEPALAGLSAHLLLVAQRAA
jgi:ubiquinone/menaquinone biosynthesis C-methylase UbiE